MSIERRRRGTGGAPDAEPFSASIDRWRRGTGGAPDAEPFLAGTGGALSASVDRWRRGTGGGVAAAGADTLGGGAGAFFLPFFFGTGGAAAAPPSAAPPGVAGLFFRPFFCGTGGAAASVAAAAGPPGGAGLFLRPFFCGTGGAAAAPGVGGGALRPPARFGAGGACPRALIESRAPPGCTPTYCGTACRRAYPGGRAVFWVLGLSAPSCSLASAAGQDQAAAGAARGGAGAPCQRASWLEAAEFCSAGTICEGSRSRIRGASSQVSGRLTR